MSKQVSHQTEYRRHMLRSEFQSLFWHAILTRKRETKFTLKALADKLGINKAYISRSFSSPPNWTVDKLSDMAEALNVELVVEARDRATGKIYTASGNAAPVQTATTQRFCDPAELHRGSNLTLDDDEYKVSVTA